MLSCVELSIKLDPTNLDLILSAFERGEDCDFEDVAGNDFKIIIDAEPAIVKVENPTIGYVLSTAILHDLGIHENIEEGVKRAFRRSGNKIKRGFRVTSGFRKGRVVSSVAGAFKPRAKASTRMKLRIASRRKKVIRVLKAKRTRKKSVSKRLARMNSR